MKKKTVTVPLAAGLLPRKLAAAALEIAQRFDLELYLRSSQALRLAGIAEEDVAEVKALLVAAGAEFRPKGSFPLPRVCSGSTMCRRGQLDTEAFSQRLLSHFAGREIKPKLKLAVAACPRSCSNHRLADIGIVATGRGLDLYAGGGGGANPKAGRKIAERLDEEGIIAALDTLLEYHNAHTEKKARMAQHLNAPDFPFPPID